jgi:hypothetical protein
MVFRAAIVRATFPTEKTVTKFQMDVTVSASSEVPVEQTLMGLPLNRLQWTNKASLAAPAFCCRRFIVEN